ncbi:MAG: sigma-E factor negative regulatory protein [Gammaproteobacteria bacterium]
MTDKLREQVSALADDSLLQGEHELLVRRFSVDRNLRLCWERYHLIGEAMRKGLPEIDTRGFADRVMAILDVEPVRYEPARNGMLAYLGKAFAGMAVAASVAAVAVIGLRHDTGHSGQSAAMAPSEIVPSSAQLNVTPASYGTVSNATWNGDTPDVQAQLGNYLINHNEMAASLSQPGVLPYFYIATYDPRTQINHPRKQNAQASVSQDNRNRR